MLEQFKLARLISRPYPFVVEEQLIELDIRAVIKTKSVEIAINVLKQYLFLLSIFDVKYLH